ncbi:PD40 domain-containing protein [Deinococcus sp. Arct2-2]|uniref:TolB family protein n=1 Tax=Deinococcus sp. Arct2-2 TaxID=2568653 RepID=UPI00197AE09C|nr:PD40 domain-containing protein [Deinococcus sp. Arct2-2]
MLTFSAPHAITQGAGTDLRANWTPDGQWIVFERLQDGRRRLHRVHPDGSNLEPFALEEPDDSDSAGRPAFFTPDDLVFVSDRLGSTALFRQFQGQVTLLHAHPQPGYGPALVDGHRHVQ